MFDTPGLIIASKEKGIDLGLLAVRQQCDLLHHCAAHVQGLLIKTLVTQIKEVIFGSLRIRVRARTFLICHR